MLQRGELRNGNKVIRKEHPDQVLTIQNKIIYIGTDPIPDKEEYQIEGVAITKEILDSCNIKEGQELDANGLTFRREADELILVDSFDQLILRIEYLHQFQNIYYDLNGKELKINI